MAEEETGSMESSEFTLVGTDVVGQDIIGKDVIGQDEVGKDLMSPEPGE